MKDLNTEQAWLTCYVVLAPEAVHSLRASNIEFNTCNEERLSIPVKR